MMENGCYFIYFGVNQARIQDLMEGGAGRIAREIFWQPRPLSNRNTTEFNANYVQSARMFAIAQGWRRANSSYTN